MNDSLSEKRNDPHFHEKEEFDGHEDKVKSR